MGNAGTGLLSFTESDFFGIALLGSLEQIRVRASSSQFNRGTIILPDEQPVSFEVTLPEAVPGALEGMHSVTGIKRFPARQSLNYISDLPNVLATVLNSFDISFEFIGRSYFSSS